MNHPPKIYIESLLEMSAGPSGSVDTRAQLVEYESTIENSPPQFDESALYVSPKSSRFSSAYRDTVNTPGFMGAGLVHFQDAIFLETCALPYLQKTDEILVGEPICWGIDFAEWYVGNHFPLGSSIKTLADTAPTLPASSIIMSAPGQDIYGHWIIDIIPRLNILRTADEASQNIYFDHIPTWADEFLTAFGFNRSQFKRHPGRVFRAEDAIVPSSSKSGYRMGRESLSAAWEQLRRHIMALGTQTDIRAEKVFLSRRSLSGGGRRTSAVMTQIEDLFLKRGFAIISPERLSIRDQASVMKSAKIVVGEDGSALHNVIFSDTPVVLGVLSLPDRLNLWHLGISQVLGHKTAYFDLPEDDNSVNLTELDEFIDSLEQMAG